MRAKSRLVPALLLVTAGASVAIACSSFSDDTPTPLPERDSGLVDGTASASDASDLDARTGDATKPVPTCPSAALLCDPFERAGGALLGDRWNDTFYTPNTVALAIDPARASTGTASLRADDRDGGGIGMLRYAFTSTSAVPVVELDVLVDALPPVGANLMQIVFTNETTVNVSLDPDGLRISTQKLDGAGYAASPATRYAPLGVWNRLRFRVDTQGFAHVESSTTSPPLNVEQPLPGKTIPPAKLLTLGLPFVSPHDASVPFSVWFDDVTVVP